MLNFLLWAMVCSTALGLVLAFVAYRWEKAKKGGGSSGGAKKSSPKKPKASSGWFSGGGGGSSDKRRKADIVNRLRSLAPECGEVAALLLNIAKSIETGRDPQGGSTNLREVVAAIYGGALMLERMGRNSQASELTFINKAIDDLAQGR